MSGPVAASAAPDAKGATFNPRVMIAVIGAAILSYVAYLYLSAYAPEMNVSRTGRGHALSNSAIGYSGIVRLRQEMGRKPQIVRSDQALKTDRLVVVMPELRADPEKLNDLVTKRASNPVLIVLPKRRVVPLPTHQGWVRGRDMARGEDIAEIVSKVVEIQVHQSKRADGWRFGDGWVPDIKFDGKTMVQTISGNHLEPYISDGNGNILLAALTDDDNDSRPVYILSDPDVINNLGIGYAPNAQAVSKVLDELSGNDDNRVDFDVTMNGLGTSNSLLKMIFEPPFLALSICLFVASLMALLFGLMRFGPPLREMRAVAPGKAALVTNTADLLRLAGLEHQTGDRYAHLTRDLTGQAMGLPQGMSGEEVEKRLDRISRTGPNFSSLANSAGYAVNVDDMLAKVRALYQWRKDKTK